jgi:hypothetical protein
MSRESGRARQVLGPGLADNARRRVEFATTVNVSIEPSRSTPPAGTPPDATLTRADMADRQARRITREPSSAEKERLAQHREQVARELPELAARDQMRKDAREETTLSGQLRRAVHESDLSLAEIAARAGITPIVLDDFLTGERTLRSDVMDRLAGVLGCALSRAE